MVAQRGVVTGLASALPPGESQTVLWDRFFSAHFSSVRGARRIFSSVKVSQRHPVVNPLVEDISGWSTARRMRRYKDEAAPLAKESLTGALLAAGRSPSELGLLVVVSCTGYSSPGLDVLLARDAGLEPSAIRILVGQLGCHAALPAIGIASDFVLSERRPAAVVCVELSSLHIQPPSDDPTQIVCHALFGDASAAAIVEAESDRPGFAIVGRSSRTCFGAADHLAWEITDQGFRMHLSRELPRHLAREIGPLVDELLVRCGIRREQVAAWAIHPGGPSILDTVQSRLGLRAETVETSRQVLSAHGNCSSPTTLLVLDEIRRRGTVGVGQFVVAMAFGPGLSAHAVLLRVT